MTGYIYIIKNDINDKVYVGQTINTLSRRMAIHCNRNNHSNSAITKAIIKYGKRHFQLIPIEIIEEENKSNLLDKLNLLEKAYIQSYNSKTPNGYNILLGGRNAKKPDCVKRKISKSLKGNPNLGYWLGKHFSEEHRRKLTESHACSKQLICLETNEIFSSIAEAAKTIGVPRITVSLSLRNKGIYQGILTFKYNTEPQNV